MAQNEFLACKRLLFGFSRATLAFALVWGRK
jgi:hypothetical protein